MSHLQRNKVKAIAYENEDVRRLNPEALDTIGFVVEYLMKQVVLQSVQCHESGLAVIDTDAVIKIIQEKQLALGIQHEFKEESTSKRRMTIRCVRKEKKKQVVVDKIVTKAKVIKVDSEEDYDESSDAT